MQIIGNNFWIRTSNFGIVGSILGIRDSGFEAKILCVSFEIISEKISFLFIVRSNRYVVYQNSLFCPYRNENKPERLNPEMDIKKFPDIPTRGTWRKML